MMRALGISIDVIRARRGTSAHKRWMLHIKAISLQSFQPRIHPTILPPHNNARY